MGKEMSVKVGEYRDYLIFYNSAKQVFELRGKEAENEVLAYADTQELIEREADKHDGLPDVFPIQAIYAPDPYGYHRSHSDRNIWIGQILAINLQKKAVIYRFEDGTIRSYILNRPFVLYELTKHNKGLVAELELLQAVIDDEQENIRQLSQKKEGLRKSFEKPINLEYFGLEARNALDERYKKE
jgi:hypothetical protein